MNVDSFSVVEYSAFRVRLLLVARKYRQYMANREVVTNRPTDYSCIAYTAMFVEVYLFILSDLHLLVFLNHRVAIVFHSHLLNYVYVRLLGVLNKYQSIYQSSPFTKDKDPI